MELPTTDQCMAFMDAVNRGRAEFGLEPLERLEFDECEPGDPENCLSARHLLVPVCDAAGCDGSVGGCEFELLDGRGSNAIVMGVAARLVRAVGTEAEEMVPGRVDVNIPDEILAVTDPFDAEVEGLRGRLEEAGLI